MPDFFKRFLRSGNFSLIARWCGALLAVLDLSGCPGPVAPIETPTPAPSTPTPSLSPSPIPTPTPTQTPLPEAFIPFSRMETARLFSGLELHSKVTSVEGGLAVAGRKTADAYQLNLEVKVEVPRPAQTLEELGQADPALGTILPGLKDQIATAKVSSFYHGLYQLKVDSLNRSLARLDQIVSRHNFFDCNTILEIQDPKTARKALLFQSDMDVNADGSDADRQSEIDGSSANFQPYTSYRWVKKTEKPNQFLPEKEAKLKQLQTDWDSKLIPSEKKKSIKDQIDQTQREIADLRRFSFLISKYDPYVVLPGFMLRPSTQPYAPKLGDLAIVIYRGTLYPALLGDAGPSYKIGEASIRLCLQLDPKSTPYIRPSSNLDITYLVFPGSADDTAGPPDLKKLHDRCASLLAEIGGYNGILWEWPDLLAQPSVTPLPAASPSPSVSPPTVPSAKPIVTPAITPAPSPTQPKSSER